MIYKMIKIYYKPKYSLISFFTSERVESSSTLIYMKFTTPPSYICIFRFRYYVLLYEFDYTMVLERLIISY